MKATIDGVEETFYLTSTGGTAGGYKYYSAYALKADGTLGKRLSININPDVSSGTTAKKGDKIKGFSLSYKTSPGGFQYSARPGKGVTRSQSRPMSQMVPTWRGHFPQLPE